MAEPRFILAIETSNPSAAGGSGGAGVAIGGLGGGAPGAVDVEHLRPTGRHDDDLMPAIDRLCARAGVRPRQIARVVVSIGPGGYTGLRIAIGAAKMIALGAGAECVGVPSAAVAALGAPEEKRKPGFAVALASKGQSTWLTLFPPAWDAAGGGAGEPAVPPGRLVTADEACAPGFWAGTPVCATGSLLPVPKDCASDGSPPVCATGNSLPVPVLIADRFLPERIADSARAAGVEIIAPVFDPRACLRLGAAMPAQDPALVNPIYPREPDAVTLWRTRLAER